MMTFQAKSLSFPNLLQTLSALIFVIAVGNIVATFFFLDGQWRHSQERFKASTNTQIPKGRNGQSVDDDDPRAPTLALAYPPGLLGGYRNQVIRFIGLCLYARRKNITRLFEPSLLWSTTTQQQSLPIPMHWIFDIDHWNLIARKEGLPRIVKTLADPDCWQTGLFRGFNTTDWGPLPTASLLESGSLAGVVNETYRVISNDPTFMIRRTDILPTLQHCKRPLVYGGGTMAGRLWNVVMRLRKRGGAIPGNLDRHVLRALQPAPRWQEVANSCLSLTPASDETYVALHARVELEMLVHPCGSTMEHNLTKIFQQVQDLVDVRRRQSPQNFVGLLVATSRSGIEYTEQYNVKLKEVAEYNVKILDHYVGDPDAKLGEHMRVFECGERLLEKFYSMHTDVPDHGSLLQAVVNFHLAVNAEIFIGVRGSSYSTDVWTTRYYMGRGTDNYRYTQHGEVEPIENGGLPDPHVDCGKKGKQK